MRSKLGNTKQLELKEKSIKKFLKEKQKNMNKCIVQE